MHPAVKPFDPTRAFPFGYYVHFLTTLAFDLAVASLVQELVVSGALRAFAFWALNFLEDPLCFLRRVWILRCLGPVLLFIHSA